MGKSISKVHPNLRGYTNLKFTGLAELEKCDVLFLCLSHAVSMKSIEKFKEIAPKIIDLSGDFRLRDKDEFEKWYKEPHSNPDLLKEFVYGIPELTQRGNENCQLCFKCRMQCYDNNFRPLSPFQE